MDAAIATLEIRDAADAAEAIGVANARNAAARHCRRRHEEAARPPRARSRANSRRARLTGVTLYEPEELVLSARAGTPLARDRGAARRQPPAARLRADGLCVALGGATRGGTHRRRVAVNASGPRRIKAGAARDHLLGFHCVTGRGEIVKSGGRVMKNVTGYDLSKLVAGSYGTLALLTEVTLKVLAQGRDRTDVAGSRTRRDAKPRAIATRLRGTPRTRFRPSRCCRLAPRRCGLHANAAAIAARGPGDFRRARGATLCAHSSPTAARISKPCRSRSPRALWSCAARRRAGRARIPGRSGAFRSRRRMGAARSNVCARTARR